jgi:hypothetical protein
VKKHRVVVTAGAFAVLTELKRGDAKWDVPRLANGDRVLNVDPDNYKELKRLQKEFGVDSISDVLVKLYRDRKIAPSE